MQKPNFICANRKSNLFCQNACFNHIGSTPETVLCIHHPVNF